MSERNSEEVRELAKAMIEMFAQMTGPTSDLIRASMAARVDGLVDAHKRFAAAGWPTYLEAPVLVALAGGRSLPAEKTE